MKIKVEYSIPRVIVSEEIEVGSVQNTHLNKRQSKLVDEAVKRLYPKLIEKFKEKKPIVKLKTL